MLWFQQRTVKFTATFFPPADDVHIGTPSCLILKTMADQADDYRHTADEDDERKAKRKKLRKGTRSCWECKRKKIKCIFKSDGNVKCETCFRRGTNCVSQDLPDEALPGGDQLHDRLGRVESLLTDLTEKVLGRYGSQKTWSYDGAGSVGPPTPISEPDLHRSRVSRASLQVCIPKNY